MDIEKIRARCFVTENGCWEWLGSCGMARYGQVRIKGKLHATHRLAFKLCNPDVDTAGLEVCHKCDNSKCCNPEHLFLATHQENMKDRDIKLRHSFKYGSEYVETITKLRMEGKTKAQIARFLSWPKQSLDRYLQRFGIESQ
jgi:hypothetical protein